MRSNLSAPSALDCSVQGFPGRVPATSAPLTFEVNAPFTLNTETVVDTLPR